MEPMRLVTYDQIYLDKSLEWLNDWEIRMMTDTHSYVNPKLQREWYERISGDSTYQIWGIEYDGKPIGACGIKHIDITKSEGEYWGYIGEKEYWGGKGHDLMRLVYKKANELGLNKLCLYVKSTNLRAKQLYNSEGFSVDIEKDDKIWMSKKL